MLVAQLNRFGAKTRRCSLAIVITKADLLVKQEPDPGTADPARTLSHRLSKWLCAMGLRNLVETAEHRLRQGEVLPGRPRDGVDGSGRAIHLVARPVSARGDDTMTESRGPDHIPVGHVISRVLLASMVVSLVVSVAVLAVLHGAGEVKVGSIIYNSVKNWAATVVSWLT